MNGPLTVDESGLRCRIHSPDSPATLIYLPGLHGDWTLLGPFRESLRGRVRLIEFTYPRRDDWSLADYACAVLAELEAQGVRGGWILGESFSSQVAWVIADQLEHERELMWRDVTEVSEMRPAFNLRGIIFVGGFVKYPLPWALRLACWTSGAMPLWLMRRAVAAYGLWAKRRVSHPSRRHELDLFVARRSTEPDRRTMTSRYRLIQAGDLRPVAREMRSPVFFLSGAIDLIVPWPIVLRWVSRWCPGFRGRRILWRAGHNVLLDSPREAAEQILFWTGKDD